MLDWWRWRNHKSDDVPNFELATLRKLPNDVLIDKMAGWEKDHKDRIRCEWVMYERKNEWTAYRAWASLFISLLALLIATMALFR